MICFNSQVYLSIDFVYIIKKRIKQVTNNIAYRIRRAAEQK